MFQKPQQYMQRARSFLTTAVHRGRHLASAMDGAVQSGLAMYGAARPILAEAAQRYASPGQQAAARASAVMVFIQNSPHHKTRKPHLTTVYAAGCVHATELGRVSLPELRTP